MKRLQIYMAWFWVIPDAYFVKETLNHIERNKKTY